MKLLQLIEQDVDDIVAERAAFAGTRLPAIRALTNADLSDHAEKHPARDGRRRDAIEVKSTQAEDTTARRA